MIVGRRAGFAIVRAGARNAQKFSYNCWLRTASVRRASTSAETVDSTHPGPEIKKTPVDQPRIRKYTFKSPRIARVPVEYPGDIDNLEISEKLGQPKVRWVPKSEPTQTTHQEPRIQRLWTNSFGRNESKRRSQLAAKETGEVPDDIEFTGRIDVQLKGKQYHLDPVFLRDSCACPACVDPSNRQKLFQTSDIPQDITAKHHSLVQRDNAQFLRIVWDKDVSGYGADHVTHLRTDWIVENMGRYSGRRYPLDRTHSTAVLWNRSIYETEAQWFDYGDYMDQDQVLHKALQGLGDWGLIFIRGIPADDEGAVERIAGRIGVLRDTFYGRTWDVQSKPDAKNIAYTKGFLGFHMDLLYTSTPPYLQFLHSLRARAPGGESLFVDAFYAAAQLKPADVKSLRTCTIPYEYHNDGEHYSKSRPVFETRSFQPYDADISKILMHVNWSPPFQGTFGGSNSLRRSLGAIAEFDALIQKPSAIYEYRLKEGECVIFNNRRVLHARREFDPTQGERWLRGAYIDEDVFHSRLAVLQERFEGSWFIDDAKITIRDRSGAASN